MSKSLQEINATKHKPVGRCGHPKPTSQGPQRPVKLKQSERGVLQQGRGSPGVSTACGMCLQSSPSERALAVLVTES